MFSSSAADPQEFSLAQSAVAVRQEAAKEEQGADHALMSEANVRAEAADRERHRRSFEERLRGHQTAGGSDCS